MHRLGCAGPFPLHQPLPSLLNAMIDPVPREPSPLWWGAVLIWGSELKSDLGGQRRREALQAGETPLPFLLSPRFWGGVNRGVRG